MKQVRYASVAVVSLLAYSAWAAAPDTASPSSSDKLRGPVAVVVADGGRWAFTANRCGTVSAIDLSARKVTRETAVGKRLSDLAVMADGRRMLAVDEASNELIVLARDGDRLEPAHRLAIGRGPVCVRTLGPSRCAVASLWERQVSIIEVGESKSSAAPRVMHTVALPLNPRLLLSMADGKRVLAADAFGGRLAVIDAEQGQVESSRSIPGHNIRGLALTPDGRDVLVAHLVLSSRAETTRDNLHWGNLLTTDVRGVATADLLDPAADLVAGSRLYPTSQTGRGAGDPAALAIAPDGTLVMALAGAGDLAIGPSWEPAGRRVKTGAQPRAVALLPDGRTACVADTFDDTVTLVDVAEAKATVTIQLGSRHEPDAASRGERLFYNARLSHEEWISCHSCHTDGHTAGLRSDTRGDGSFGAPKRTPTLLGVAATGPWAWDGSAADLADQLRRTMDSTMHAENISDMQLSELAAYLATLSPPPPALVAPANDAALARGKQVFERRQCADCHAGPAYTSAETYDIGLVDEVGRREFNPPSLRGVGQAATLYHDGRARSLEELFTKHPHATTAEVTPEERDDLLRFLRSL